MSNAFVKGYLWYKRHGILTQALWAKRWIELGPTVLTHFDEENGTVCGYFPLRGATVEPCNPGYAHCFTVTTSPSAGLTSAHRHYIFQAPDDYSRDRWIESIQKRAQGEQYTSNIPTTIPTGSECPLSPTELEDFVIVSKSSDTPSRSLPKIDSFSTKFSQPSRSTPVRFPQTHKAEQKPPSPPKMQVSPTAPPLQTHSQQYRQLPPSMTTSETVIISKVKEVLDSLQDIAEREIPPVVNNQPLAAYYHLASKWIQEANVARAQGNFEEEYVCLLRYSVLILQRINLHFSYNNMSNSDEKISHRNRVKTVLADLEKLQERIREKYRNFDIPLSAFPDVPS